MVYNFISLKIYEEKAITQQLWNLENSEFTPSKFRRKKFDKTVRW